MVILSLFGSNIGFFRKFSNYSNSNSRDKKFCQECGHHVVWLGKILFVATKISMHTSDGMCGLTKFKVSWPDSMNLPNIK